MSEPKPSFPETTPQELANLQAEVAHSILEYMTAMQSIARRQLAAIENIKADIHKYVEAVLAVDEDEGGQ